MLSPAMSGGCVGEAGFDSRPLSWATSRCQHPVHNITGDGQSPELVGSTKGHRLLYRCACSANSSSESLSASIERSSCSKVMSARISSSFVERRVPSHCSL
jgi:hypothetical protein